MTSKKKYTRMSSSSSLHSSSSSERKKSKRSKSQNPENLKSRNGENLKSRNGENLKSRNGENLKSRNSLVPKVDIHSPLITKPSFNKQLIARTNDTRKSIFGRLIKKSLLMGFVGCSTILRKCIEWSTESHIPSNLPRIHDPILLMNINQLTRAIKSGKLTCAQVMKAYLDRIKIVNPVLNAFCDIREEEAMFEARILDKRIQAALRLKYEEGSYNNNETDKNNNYTSRRRGSHKRSSLSGEKENFKNPPPDDVLSLPLLGVPVTIKNSIAVAGCIQDAGIPMSAGRRAPKDSVVVERIKSAGGIILGITNIPEGLAFWETANKIYGSTKNPYDMTRTPAGSSGGEASAISSGCSLIGLGTDMAGSVRLPAASCGIYGHKVSCDTITCFDSLFPEQPRPLGDVLVIGPMTRYVEDMEPFLDVVVDNDKKQLMNIGSKVDFSNMTIYILDHENNGDILSDKPSDRVNWLINKSANYFKKKFGTKVEKITFWDQKRVCAYMLSATKARRDASLREMFDPNFNVLWELFQVFTLTSKYKYFTVFMTLFETFLTPSRGKLLEHERAREELKKEVISKLGANGVLFTPTLPDVAVKVDTTFTRFPDCAYTAFFNVLQLPATHVPMGLTKQGVPIGFEVGAAPNQDNLTIQVVKELSRKFAGWIEPGSYPLKSEG